MRAAGDVVQSVIMRVGFLGGVRVWALGLAVVGASCGSSSAPATPGPVARFKLSANPALLDVPFPSDVYLSNGAIVEVPGMDRVVARNGQFITHELSKQNGFARTGMALFLVDDESKPKTDDGEVAWADLDATSLPKNEDACVADASSVFLIDLEADAPKARVRCRARLHDDTSRSNTRPTLAVGPGLGIVLEEGHRYAAVITSRVKDKAGRAIGKSADLRDLKAGAGAAGMYAAALDKVRAAIPKDADVVALAPFTTNTSTREMFRLREALEDVPVPKLAWDAPSVAPMGAVRFAAPVMGALPAGFTATLDAWLGVATQKAYDGHDDTDALLPVRAHDMIAAIGTAALQAQNYLISKPGGYPTLDHATFARDASGAIVPAPDRPTAPIWVSLAIPKGDMPAGGWPCVLIQHGVGGSRADIFMVLANAFAAKGIATAGIDSVTFGARAVDPKFRVDQRTDYEDAPGATYAGPDGISDRLDANGQPSSKGDRADALDVTGGGLNFGAVRDQWRQGEIDITQVLRVLTHDPDLSPLQTGAAPPKIDAAKVGYLGGSQGAIEGAVAAALEPSVKSWALNVGGGNLLLLAGHATSTEVQLVANALLNFGVTGQTLDEAGVLLNLVQSVVDPFDPINYAPYLVQRPGTIKGQSVGPRNILAIEALYDALVANDGSEAFARAAGIGLAGPNAGPNAGVDTLERARDPRTVPDPIPLPTIMPDANQQIHDTPVPGVTAVLVQAGPATHYENILMSHSTRSVGMPYSTATKLLARSFTIKQSYREQRDMIVQFFADAFSGKVPNVGGFKAPVRDFDDDGTPDATDPDPNDPTVR